MKATLEFNLPDEQFNFKRSVDGPKWFFSCYEFNDYLRNKIKYDNLNSRQIKLLEEIQKELNEIIFNNGLILEQF